MRKRIIVSIIHLLFLLLACFVMFFTMNRHNSTCYEYVNWLSMAAVTKNKFNTYIVASICVLILSVIDFALAAFHAIEALKNITHKNPAVNEFLKTIFWCVMTAMSIASLYMYIMYYIVFIT